MDLDPGGWATEGGTQNTNLGVWGNPEIRAEELATSVRSKMGEVSP